VGNVEDRGDQRRARPSHRELERAIASVPGVVEAVVARGEEGTGRSRLRIRLAPGEDAEAVSWAVAATLRERFGIALDPDDIRPRRPTPEPGPVTPVTEAAATVEELRESRERLSQAAREAVEGVRRPGPRRGAADPLDVLWGRDVGTRAAAGAGEEVGTAEPVPGAPAEREVARRPTARTAGRRSRSSGTLRPRGPRRPPRRPGAPEEPTPAAEEPEALPAVEAAVAAAPVPPTDEARPRDREAVRLPEAAPGPAGPQPPVPHRRRAAIRTLDTRRDRRDVRVTATLEHEGRAAQGQASAAATGQGVLRAVADATVGALRGLTSERLTASIDRITLDPAHDPATAMVTVTLVSDRGEERLVGSSVVRNDPERAVMRATLDALNRRAAALLADEPAGAGS
jgi:hypothetical protein